VRGRLGQRGNWLAPGGNRDGGENKDGGRPGQSAEDEQAKEGKERNFNEHGYLAITIRARLCDMWSARRAGHACQTTCAVSATVFTSYMVP
jgi:hypothetical protein